MGNAISAGIESLHQKVVSMWHGCETIQKQATQMAELAYKAVCELESLKEMPEITKTAEMLEKLGEEITILKGNLAEVRLERDEVKKREDQLRIENLRIRNVFINVLREILNSSRNGELSEKIARLIEVLPRTDISFTDANDIIGRL